MSKETDLDVTFPEQVTPRLRNAADMFNASASELSSSWQERAAGRPWEIIADELNKAADRIDMRLKGKKRR